MSTERTCRKCGANIDHRHGRAKRCEDCQGNSNYFYSEGKTCPICGVPVTNKSTFCRQHAHPKDTAILNRDKELLDRYLAGEKCIRLAEEYGISRERVRQIIAKHDVDTPRQKTNHCIFCGKETKGKDYCCPQHWPSREKTNRCIICNQPIRHNSTACVEHINCDPWRINRIVDLYETGLTEAQVADELHVSWNTVHHSLTTAGRNPTNANRHGCFIKPKPPNHCYVCGTPISHKATYCTKHQHDPWKVNAVISTRRQGMKLSEIADAVGLSTSHVSRILKTFGETRKSS